MAQYQSRTMLIYSSFFWCFPSRIIVQKWKLGEAADLQPWHDVEMKMTVLSHSIHATMSARPMDLPSVCCLCDSLLRDFWLWTTLATFLHSYGMVRNQDGISVSLLSPVEMIAFSDVSLSLSPLNVPV